MRRSSLSDVLFLVARLVPLVILAGLIVAFLSACQLEAEPVEPTVKFCREQATSAAAVNLCLKVQGCVVMASDLLTAMRDSQAAQAAGCPE